MAEHFDHFTSTGEASIAGGTLLYHWSVRDIYLISALYDGFEKIEACPGEAAADAARRILDRDQRPQRVIVHIDNSLPADFVRTLPALGESLTAQGVEVWNAKLGDIRKSTVQAHNAAMGLPRTATSRTGPDDELLIVKTNLNSRGYSEWILTTEQRAALGWPPPTPSPLHGRDGYLVMCRKEIPETWWNDPQAMIERYVDNRYGLFYRAYLVGEAVVLCEGRATTLVRRMRDAGDRYDILLSRDLVVDPLAMAALNTPVAEVFGTTVVFAETFQVDFGSIDFVIDNNGVPYVVDVNATPYWGPLEGDGAMLQHLRRGLFYQ